MPIFKKAFTLIELLVVVAILSTLAGAIIYSTDNAREKGKDARRKGDLQAISAGLVSYFADHGQYPPTVDGNPKILDYSSDEDGWIPDIDEYLEKLPKDPLQASLPNFFAGIFNAITGENGAGGDVASAKSSNDNTGQIVTGLFLSYDAKNKTLELLDYSNSAKSIKIAIDSGTEISPNQNLGKLSSDRKLEVYLAPNKDQKTAQLIIVGELMIPPPPKR